ncbi:hypothetical protein M271_45720 [Streptomyces rapamycinicus NRRL 5491]|nr:hypothetical protein M271_45720 [Streptomyces rapamycinicus NRRL 5491]
MDVHVSKVHEAENTPTGMFPQRLTSRRTPGGI